MSSISSMSARISDYFLESPAFWMHVLTMFVIFEILIILHASLTMSSSIVSSSRRCREFVLMLSYEYTFSCFIKFIISITNIPAALLYLSICTILKSSTCGSSMLKFVSVLLLSQSASLLWISSVILGSCSSVVMEDSDYRLFIDHINFMDSDLGLFGQSSSFMDSDFVLFSQSRIFVGSECTFFKFVIINNVRSQLWSRIDNLVIIDNRQVKQVFRILVNVVIFTIVVSIKWVFEQSGGAQIEQFDIRQCTVPLGNL